MSNGVLVLSVRALVRTRKQTSGARAKCVAAGINGGRGRHAEDLWSEIDGAEEPQIVSVDHGLTLTDRGQSHCV